MRKFKITYEERGEERYPVENDLLRIELRSTGKILSRITTLDVYDIEIDEGFVAIWIDDSHKGSAPDMAINASLVYKIERIEEDNK